MSSYDMDTIQPSSQKTPPKGHVHTDSVISTTRTSSTSSAMSPTEYHIQGHTRTFSRIGTSELPVGIRSNRFSVSFPVQLTAPPSPERGPSPVTSGVSSSVDGVNSQPAMAGTNFLTAIAAQERRVLELKEEVTRAEAELTSLKRQWAQHEAEKKRSEAKTFTKLQPVQAAPVAGDNEDDIDGSNAWMHAEMERRKALMNRTRSRGRTVFAGSKHARTLSLLTPAQPQKFGDIERDMTAQHLRTQSTAETAICRKDALDSHDLVGNLARASTTPNLTLEVADSVIRDAGIDRDAIVQTGKKMATGFRDGLWTLLEDLRQVTVGDEASSDRNRILPPRRSSRHPPNFNASGTADLMSGSDVVTVSPAQTKVVRPAKAQHTSSLASMAIAKAPALADPDFWKEHGIRYSPSTKSSGPRRPGFDTSKANSRPTSMVETSSDAAWDTWDDEPHDTCTSEKSRFSSAGSETLTPPTTNSDVASPRPSTETAATQQSLDKPVSRSPIPWPALSSFGPKILTRTASNLMSEWERSITPDPSEACLQNVNTAAASEASALEIGTTRRR